MSVVYLIHGKEKFDDENFKDYLGKIIVHVRPSFVTRNNNFFHRKNSIIYLYGYLPLNL